MVRRRQGASARRGAERHAARRTLLVAGQDGIGRQQQEPVFGVDQPLHRSFLAQDRGEEVQDRRARVVVPVPPGGRQSRFGKTVIVHFTVTTDGRARDCTVASSSVDAETTARVCPLVVQRIRFNPARRADGTAVEARYGYRVSFTAR